MWQHEHTTSAYGILNSYALILGVPWYNIDMVHEPTRIHPGIVFTRLEEAEAEAEPDADKEPTLSTLI
jgi:hypothetical protein